MLNLHSAIPNTLQCYSTPIRAAIVGLFNISGFGSEQRNQPLGKPDGIEIDALNRIFGLIQGEPDLDPYPYIDSSRCRRNPEPT